MTTVITAWNQEGKAACGPLKTVPAGAGAKLALIALVAPVREPQRPTAFGATEALGLTHVVAAVLVGREPREELSQGRRAV